MIYKTSKLVEYVASKSKNIKDTHINSIHKEVMQPAATFLLVKDSKASFTIEGENQGTNRTLRWGKAIGEAG